MNSAASKFSLCLAAVCVEYCVVSTLFPAFGQQFDSLPRIQPETQQQPDTVPKRLVEPAGVPDFPSSSGYGTPAGASANSPEGAVPQASFDNSPQAQSGGSAALQSGLQSTTLPVQTQLKLVLETTVDAKTSHLGEIFEAHVRDDLYVGSSLLLPRGSLVRGRIFNIQKPRLISRAAKVSLRLEQIVTPTGEVIPLDAALTFNKGKTNARGELDPGTNFGTRVTGDVKTATGANAKGTTRGAIVAANVATLGAPAVAALIGGSTVALFKSGDNVDLKPGDEVEVCLTNDLGLQLN